jgi:hypothetical protein
MGLAAYYETSAKTDLKINEVFYSITQNAFAAKYPGGYQPVVTDERSDSLHDEMRFHRSVTNISDADREAQSLALSNTRLDENTGCSC